MSATNPRFWYCACLCLRYDYRIILKKYFFDSLNYSTYAYCATFLCFSSVQFVISFFIFGISAVVSSWAKLLCMFIRRKNLQQLWCQQWIVTRMTLFNFNIFCSCHIGRMKQQLYRLNQLRKRIDELTHQLLNELHEAELTDVRDEKK